MVHIFPQRFIDVLAVLKPYMHKPPAYPASFSIQRLPMPEEVRIELFDADDHCVDYVQSQMAPSLYLELVKAAMAAGEENRIDWFAKHYNLIVLDQSSELVLAKSDLGDIYEQIMDLDFGFRPVSLLLAA